LTLTDFFYENPKAALGFSGGVDSAYLLYAGLQCGADLQPYFVKTAFQPQFEVDDAVKLCKQLNVTLNIIDVDILSLHSVAKNPQDRCYYCKHTLFQALQRRAHADGYFMLIDGTNASDDATDRPGMRALKELAVRSPLRECGLTKKEIRHLSQQAGLFTWDKPAYACLATRIPTGTPLTQECLTRVEMGESALFQLGFRDFRIRVFHDAARIQLPQAQMQRAACHSQAIRHALAPYFQTVFLDLAGR
jgi:uncharacterized protein